MNSEKGPHCPDCEALRNAARAARNAGDYSKETDCAVLLARHRATQHHTT